MTFCKLPLICMAGLLCTFSTAFASPVRVMPLGDSITQNEPGYRGALFVMLKEAGYDIEFVGPKKGIGGGHAGFGGYTIGPGKSKADEWSNGKGNLYVNIDDWLKTHPDIVLLLIGVNDYFNNQDPGYKADQDGPGRLAGLLDKIHAVSPESRVLVSSILPVAWDANFAKTYNAALPEVVAKRPFATFVNLNSKVEFADGDWQKDGLHLTPSGDRKVAKVWFDALSPFLSKTEALSMNAQVGNTAGKASEVPKLNPVTPIWSFRTQKPTYGYAAWQKLDSVGKITLDGWLLEAAPDGGFGIVLPYPLNLADAKSLVVRMRKAPSATCKIHLKLMCEPGHLSYAILNSEVPAELGDLVLDLSSPHEGEGNLSSVKQIQIQGNFNKGETFAYTIAEIGYESK